VRNTGLEQALGVAEELELVTTGRRSGEAHVVRVWFAYADGAIWLRTDRAADWLRNLERDPRCRIRVDGHEHSARREPIADEAAALRHLIDFWRAKYGQEWVADWYVERGRVPVRLVLGPEP
jgi:hypothetical protein